MKKFAMLGLAAALFTGTAANAATNYVLNGSFEEDHTVIGSSWRVFNTVGDWTTLSGAGIEIQGSGVVVNAQDGNFYVELDSHNGNGGATGVTTNTSMGQMLSLTQGSYQLSFWYRPRTSTVGDNGILASINGFDLLADGVKSGGSDWNQYLLDFSVGSDGDYLLSFGANGQANTLGGFMDNVSVSAIPEPGTWLMMVMGFGLVGVSMRRRKGLSVKLA